MAPSCDAALALGPKVPWTVRVQAGGVQHGWIAIVLRRS